MQKTTEANLSSDCVDITSVLAVCVCESPVSSSVCLSPDASTASKPPPVSVWSQLQVLALLAYKKEPSIYTTL